MHTISSCQVHDPALALLDEANPEDSRAERGKHGTSASPGNCWELCHASSLPTLDLYSCSFLLLAAKCIPQAAGTQSKRKEGPRPALRDCWH